MDQRNSRKEAFREAERKNGEEDTLESGLVLAKVISRKGTPQETYRCLDKLYLIYGDKLKEALTQPRLPETFSTYHADITETVEYRGQSLIRREAQGLKAIIERYAAHLQATIEVGPGGGIILREFECSVAGGQTRMIELRHYDLECPPEELHQVPYLTELNLERNQLTNLEGLPNLPQLQELNLGFNKITTTHGLPNLPQLQILHLYGNQLTTLEWLPNLPQLKVLYLSGNITLPNTGDRWSVPRTRIQYREIKELQERGVEVYF